MGYCVSGGKAGIRKAFMTRTVVKAEAERLIQEFGPKALGKAQDAVRLCLRRRNVKMSAFRAAVVSEIERRQSALAPLESPIADPK